MASQQLEPYQQQFISFLVRAQALRFGEFTTKSGRETPYFVNAGCFNTGEHIVELGSFYAAHALRHSIANCTTFFGPAYKGVPLAVAVASALWREHQLRVGFTFDRKEEKTHGDKGRMVGTPLNAGDSVVIVEDVITAGTTLRRMVPVLRDEYKVDIRGVIIAVDRCEKGEGTLSALQEAQNDLQLEIFPIVNIRQIVEHLSHENDSGLQLNQQQLQQIQRYWEQYGA